MQRSKRIRQVTPAEAKLWRTVMADVAPLPGKALPPDEPEAEPVATTIVSPAPPPSRQPPPPSSPHSHELRHGHTPGVDRRNADRLRRGQLDIEARLDLHGLTQEAAHVALNGFISRSHALGRRCVLVITGKGLRGEGGGVLRAAVPGWLNDRPLRGMVLAFTYAQARDGGEGALYIMLKRRR